MRTFWLGFRSGLPYRRHQIVKKGASTGSPQLLALAGMGTATAAAAAALVAEAIHKSFGDLEVLKGVSLTARAGAVIAMLGSSGSGNSTFLRCMNLLARPNAGRLVVAGEELRLTPSRGGAPEATAAAPTPHLRPPPT